MADKFLEGVVTKDKLLYLMAKIEATFSKFSGSYNDLTDKPTIPEAYTLPKANSSTLGGIMVGDNLTIDSNGKLSADAQSYDEATTSAAGLMSAADKVKLNGIATGATAVTKVSQLTNDSSFATTSEVATAVSNGVSGLATETYVDSKLSATYKAAGSIAFANLPTPADSVLGYVYNITNSFTTTSSFVEGAGQVHPAGTNVAVVYYNETYMFDVLSGFIDLSDYVLASEISEITNEEIDAMFEE